MGADPKEAATLLLLKHIRETKNAGYTYMRETRVVRELVKKLQMKYELSSPQQVYEMAILSIGLKIPPEEVARIIKLRGRKLSQLALLRIYEELFEKIATEG